MNRKIIALPQCLDYGDIEGSLSLRKTWAAVIHATTGYRWAEECLIVLPSKKTLERSLDLIYPHEKPVLKNMADKPVIEKNGDTLFFQEITTPTGDTLCLVLSQNPQCISDLKLLAELTYSRIPLVSEQRMEQHLALLIIPPYQTIAIGFTPEYTSFRKTSGAIKAFTSDTTEASRVVDAQTIAWDYGSNQLPMPPLFWNWLHHASRSQTETTDLDPVVSAYLEKEFHLKTSHLAYGLGTAPLFEATISVLKQQVPGITAVFPQGAYGEFINTSNLHDIPIHCIQTQKADGFKLTPHHLEEAASSHKGPLLIYINAPFINPTAQQYSTEELTCLKKTADSITAATGQPVIFIIDTIFNGLHFGSDTKPDLNLSAFSEDIVLGGVSKQAALGGLRFGWCSAPTSFFAKTIQDIADTPPTTVLGVVRQFYSALQEDLPELIRHFDTQLATLKRREDILTQCLNAFGWSVLPPKGGLFLVAKPPDTWTQKEDAATHIFEDINLRVNSAKWTGLIEDGYCRFLLSVREADFQDGMHRLRQYLQQKDHSSSNRIV